MADRIAQIAAANADTRALVEEGLREQYKADNREIPQNFIDIVNTLTALALKYGVDNLSSKNELIFDIYSGVQSTVVTGIFNYSGDDPAPKAFAKAVAGLIGTFAFECIGLKGVTNVVGGYYSGDFLSTLVDKGYDVYYGPDYTMSDNKATNTFNFTVDYTLADALLLPEKLKSFLKSSQVNSNWSLTDRNGYVLNYKYNENSYVLEKTSFATARDTKLIDGLFYFDNGMTPGIPLTIEFSDTSTLTLKAMSMFYDEMASLAKSDGRILYALINLDTFYIDSATAPFANPANYTDAFIEDRSQMLWLYSWEMKNAQEHHGDLLYDPKTPPREYAVQNNLYFLDMSRGIEYGHQLNGTTSIIFGTSKSDSIDGTSEFDRLYGMGGDDFIRGGEGSDYIEGGTGDDNIHGDEGADEIHAGEGNDRIIGGSVFLNDTQNYGDKLYGEAGDDYIEGGAGNDHLEGGTGTDTLHGGSDNDTLLGGTDTDYLYGESGSDTLLGGDDNASDILVGGSGEDTLLGQGGDDVMVGGNSLEDIYSEKVSDYLSGGSGYDTYYVSHQDIISKSFKKVA